MSEVTSYRLWIWANPLSRSLKPTHLQSPTRPPNPSPSNVSVSGLLYMFNSLLLSALCRSSIPCDNYTVQYPTVSQSKTRCGSYNYCRINIVIRRTSSLISLCLGNDFIMGLYFAFWPRQEAYGKGDRGIQLKTDPIAKSSFLFEAGAEEAG